MFDLSVKHRYTTTITSNPEEPVVVDLGRRNIDLSDCKIDRLLRSDDDGAFVRIEPKFDSVLDPETDELTILVTCRFGEVLTAVFNKMNRTITLTQLLDHKHSYRISIDVKYTVTGTED